MVVSIHFKGANTMRVSKREQDVYDFIKAFMLKNNVTPSIREISEGLGLTSVSPIHYHMKGLIKAGLVIPYGENTIRYSIKGVRMKEDHSNE